MQRGEEESGGEAEDDKEKYFLSQCLTSDVTAVVLSYTNVFHFAGGIPDHFTRQKMGNQVKLGLRT